MIIHILHPGRANVAASCKWSEPDVLLFTGGDFVPTYACTKPRKTYGRPCRLLDLRNPHPNCVNFEAWEGPEAIFRVGENPEGDNESVSA